MTTSALAMNHFRTHQQPLTSTQHSMTPNKIPATPCPPEDSDNHLRSLSPVLERSDGNSPFIGAAALLFSGGWAPYTIVGRRHWASCLACRCHGTCSYYPTQHGFVRFCGTSLPAFRCVGTGEWHCLPASPSDRLPWIPHECRWVISKWYCSNTYTIVWKLGNGGP